MTWPILSIAWARRLLAGCAADRPAAACCGDPGNPAAAGNSAAAASQTLAVNDTDLPPRASGGATADMKPEMRPRGMRCRGWRT